MAQNFRTEHDRLPYLPFLDGVRAIAVLLVMAAHFPFVAGSAASQSLWTISQALRTGYIGVDLFFVLSGFLITRILLNERAATGTISLRAFYVNRALRIFPIYYLCVGIYAVLFARGDGDLASLASYTFNVYKPFHPDPIALEHTWSLSVEEQFYLAWPFVILAIPERWGKAITGIVIPCVGFGAALVIAENFESAVAATIIYMSVVTRMMSLSLGACLAFRERGGDMPRPRRPVAIAAAGLFVLGCDNIGRAAHIVPAGGFYWSGALAGYALFSFGVIMLLIDATSLAMIRVRSLLGCAPLRYVGRISYGLYLYHYFILYLFALAPYQTEHVGTTWPRAATALLVTFITAHLSYRYLERPLLRLKSRRRVGVAPAKPAFSDFKKTGQTDMSPVIRHCAPAPTDGFVDRR